MAAPILLIIGEGSRIYQHPARAGLGRRRDRRSGAFLYKTFVFMALSVPLRPGPPGRAGFAESISRAGGERLQAPVAMADKAATVCGRIRRTAVGADPDATLAQLVEHTLGKGEVVGSSPMGGFDVS